MTVPDHRSNVKSNPSGPHSFSPDDPIPASVHAMRRALSPALASASPTRIRYRLRIEWADGVELVAFSNPTKLLDLHRRVHETPDRVLLGIQIEATAKPKWEVVPTETARWLAARHERRKRGAR